MDLAERELAVTFGLAVAVVAAVQLFLLNYLFLRLDQPRQLLSLQAEGQAEHLKRRRQQTGTPGLTGLRQVLGRGLLLPVAVADPAVRHPLATLLVVAMVLISIGRLVVVAAVVGTEQAFLSDKTAQQTTLLAAVRAAAAEQELTLRTPTQLLEPVAFDPRLETEGEPQGLLAQVLLPQEVLVRQALLTL